MIQHSDVEQECSRCKYKEKRLKWMEGFATCWSPWRDAKFIDALAKEGR
jgi:hypothetical protein